MDVARTGDEIRLAGGTYTGVQARHGVTQTLYLSKTLTIRGGYTPTNWSTPDPVANPTILNAQRQGRVVSITGSISPMLEGLCFTNGAADRESEFLDVRRSGGGILVVTATVTLRDNWIMTNQAFRGGGLYIYAGTVHLSGNTIAENQTTSGDGGGVYLIASTGVLTSNTIISNTTIASGFGDPWTPPSGGGGLYAWRSAVTLMGNTIAANSAFAQGGGVNVEEGTITMTGNMVVNNGLGANRNGMVGAGGGLFIRLSPGAVMSNTISGNQAGVGGGVYLASRTTLLKGNLIADNRATAGGGVDLASNRHVMEGNRILHNHAYHGGGVYISSHSSSTLVNDVIQDNSATSGSGVYLSGGTAEFIHTTIARNRDGSGSGGTGVYVADYSPQSSVMLTNTVLVSHTVGLLVEPGNSATLSGVLWFGNEANTGGAGTISVTNAVTGDPAFAKDGYHLTFRSAARGRGTPTTILTDIDGEERTPDSVDLGADQLLCPMCTRLYLPLVLKP